MVEFETNLGTHAENTIVNYVQLFNNINHNCSLYSLFNIHCFDTLNIFTFLHHMILMLCFYTVHLRREATSNII